MKLPSMTAPCKDCPFRIDCLKGWLGADRMKNIIEQESFVCHKNTDLQCAGHMIHNKASNLFYRMAKALGIDLNLKNEEVIYQDSELLIKHHERKRNTKSC